MGRILLTIALVFSLLLGLVAAVGCDGNGNGDTTVDGDTGNGETTDGDTTDGDTGDDTEPVIEPDLSGLGLVIDCDENTGEEDPGVGDPALDFRFQDAAGNTFSLSYYGGSLVMLNFWSTNCGFCIAEMPYIQQLYDEWPPEDLVLLTISKDTDPADVAVFLDENEYSLPIIVDRDEYISRQYGVTGIPCTLIIDGSGVIQYKRVGYFPSYQDIVDAINQVAGDYVPTDEDDTSGMAVVIECDENTSGEDPEVGDEALDFRFRDTDGQPVYLSDFRGTPVVLNFWSTGCGYCILEMPELQQLYEQWPSDKLALLTIDKGEEPAEVAAFLEDEGAGYTFPVVVDQYEEVTSQYGVTGIPRTFFIDEDGVIRYIKVGYFQSYQDIEDILSQLGWP